MVDAFQSTSPAYSHRDDYPHVLVVEFLQIRQITQYFLGWNYHRIQLWKGPARKRRGKTKSDRSDQQFGRYAAVFPRTNNSCSENWIQYRIKLRSIRNSSKTQSWKTAFGLYRSSQDRTSQVPWYSIFHHRRRSASRYVTGTGCWTRLYYFHRGTTGHPECITEFGLLCSLFRSGISAIIHSGSYEHVSSCNCNRRRRE